MKHIFYNLTSCSNHDIARQSAKYFKKQLSALGQDVEIATITYVDHYLSIPSFLGKATLSYMTHIPLCKDDKLFKEITDTIRYQIFSHFNEMDRLFADEELCISFLTDAHSSIILYRMLNHEKNDNDDYIIMGDENKVLRRKHGTLKHGTIFFIGSSFGFYVVAEDEMKNMEKYDSEELTEPIIFPTPHFSFPIINIFLADDPLAYMVRPLFFTKENESFIAPFETRKTMSRWLAQMYKVRSRKVMDLSVFRNLLSENKKSFIIDVEILPTSLFGFWFSKIDYFQIPDTVLMVKMWCEAYSEEYHSNNY